MNTSDVPRGGAETTKPGFQMPRWLSWVGVVLCAAAITFGASGWFLAIALGGLAIHVLATLQPRRLTAAGKRGKQ